MIVSILRSAEAELDGAIEHYNEESPGLGFEFMDEFLKTINRIVTNPNAWQKLSPRTRRAMTNRFPYGVIYQNRGGEVLVVAVMHLHRHPDSWKK